RPPGRAPGPSRRIASSSPCSLSVRRLLLCGQQPLVLALFPFERALAPGEPGVHRVPEPRLVPEPRGEREVGKLDAEARAELLQRAELVHLAETVDAIAARPPPGDDEARLLEVAEHPGRPPRLPRSGADGQLHPRNLTIGLSSLRPLGGARALPAVRVLEPDDVVELRR